MAFRRAQPEPAAKGETRRILYVTQIEDCLADNGLVVKVAESAPKKNGGWRKPKFHWGSIRDVSQLDFDDRRMLGLLSGSGGLLAAHHAGENAATRNRVPADSVGVIVPLLCETGRYFLGDIDEADSLQPLRWDDGPAWTFHLVEIGRAHV